MATKPQQTAQESGAAFSLDTAAVLAEESTGEIAGRSPWYLAWRRLRKNYVALGFGSESCQTFLQARSNGLDLPYRHWVTGYLIAVNKLTKDTVDM